MKVFISGVAGFLGSHLADRMLALGHSVTGVDNLIGGDVANIPKNAEFINADCGSLDKMTDCLQGCDLIYHTACTAYEGLSVFSPSFVTQNTFQITSTILSAAIRCKVPKIVYCSSMARYGDHGSSLYNETMVCKPQDPYGIAKYASELLCKNLCTTHGMDYVIAVPHNIIGPRQKYDDPYRNVVSIMINMILQGKQPVIYGNGEQSRCFTDIDDAINCLEIIGFQGNINGHVINIGPDQNFISINDLASLILRKLRSDLIPRYEKNRPQEVLQAVCSSEKARNLIGYEASVSLDESLDKVIHGIKERGPKAFQYHVPLEIENELTPLSWKFKQF